MNKIFLLPLVLVLIVLVSGCTSSNYDEDYTTSNNQQIQGSEKDSSENVCTSLNGETDKLITACSTYNTKECICDITDKETSEKLDYVVINMETEFKYMIIRNSRMDGLAVSISKITKKQTSKGFDYSIMLQLENTGRNTLYSKDGMSNEFYMDTFTDFVTITDDLGNSYEVSSFSGPPEMQLYPISTNDGSNQWRLSSDSVLFSIEDVDANAEWIQISYQPWYFRGLSDNIYWLKVFTDDIEYG